MKERDLLRLRGPHGSFFLREDSAKPMLLVAGGTGFAPIKAIVEHAIAEGTHQANAHLLGWSLSRRPLPAGPGRTVACAASPYSISPRSSPTRRQTNTGRVDAAWCMQWRWPITPDLSGHQAYVCGSPAMVAAARQDFLTHCQLPPEEFFADSFDFAADTLKAMSAKRALHAPNTSGSSDTRLLR
jgi:CDP-4-dehydro-6-deoxyglucose reductase